MSVVPFRLSRAWIVAVAAATLSVVAVPAAQPRPDKLIVAGQRVGAVRRGMSAAELYRVLGDPQGTETFEKSTMYHFAGLDVLVLNKDFKVDQIMTNSADYATAEGIAVGSSDLAVRAKLSKPNLVRDYSEIPVEARPGWYCWSDGLVVMTQMNRVVSITVWSPGCPRK